MAWPFSLIVIRDMVSSIVKPSEDVDESKASRKYDSEIANAIYPFIMNQKKNNITVNINGFIHTIIPIVFVDNPRFTEFIMLGRNAIHKNANSHREENRRGRLQKSVLRAMNIKAAAIRRKIAGIANLKINVVCMAVVFAFAGDTIVFP